MLFVGFLPPSLSSVPTPSQVFLDCSRCYLIPLSFLSLCNDLPVICSKVKSNRRDSYLVQCLSPVTGTVLACIWCSVNTY